MPEQEDAAVMEKEVVKAVARTAASPMATWTWEVLEADRPEAVVLHGAVVLHAEVPVAEPIWAL